MIKSINYKKKKIIVVSFAIIITVIFIFLFNNKYMSRAKSLILQSAQVYVINSVIDVYKRCYILPPIKSPIESPFEYLLKCPNKNKINEFSKFMANYLKNNYQNPFDTSEPLVINKNLTNCSINTSFGGIYIYDDAKKVRLKTCNVDG